MKTTKTINGLEVITREPAIGKHPHPNQNGKLVPISGVTKVLLADADGNDVEIYECDERGCEYTANNVHSVVAHMGSHVERQPAYSDEVLEEMIRAVLRAQHPSVGGHRGHMTRAAEALNAKGVKTASGEPWNASQLSHLFNKYKARFSHIRVRVMTPQPISAPPATPTKTAVSTAVAEPKAKTEPKVEPKVPVKLNRVKPEVTLERVSTQIGNLITETSALIERAGTLQQFALNLRDDITALKNAKTDPEVVAKARQFDAMMNIIASGGDRTKK